ncbi:hypothetical protein B0H16DRAFT_1777412 [Mycena metata]|uniref:Uncharacterized protein n=1 Tax=Mycena metata TaxID=1033252 RepID=A0AAD7HVK3_9AGAR|nr:hypothetical protein B0H16DRAFT_1777412 [Mycena metata]
MRDGRHSKIQSPGDGLGDGRRISGTPLSTPSAPPSRLWSAVPGSTSPRRASTSTAPMSPFPVSSSPSDGGNPNAIPDTDTDLDMDMDMGADADDGEEDTDAHAIAAALRDAGVDALGRVVSSSSASASTALAILRLPQTRRGATLSRLTHVLEHSALYSSVLERQMREGKGRKDTNPPRLPYSPQKKPRIPAFPQPHQITGATLHPYQLEGPQWMLGLDEQGISGIFPAGQQSFPTRRRERNVVRRDAIMPVGGCVVARLGFVRAALCDILPSPPARDDGGGAAGRTERVVRGLPDRPNAIGLDSAGARRGFDCWWLERESARAGGSWRTSRVLWSHGQVSSFAFFTRERASGDVSLSFFTVARAWIFQAQLRPSLGGIYHFVLS